MKITSHLASALPAAGLLGVMTGDWVSAGLFVLGAAVLPDTAHALAQLRRAPWGTIPPPLMPIYRAGHSLLVWGPLALVLPLPVIAGVALHLLMDWPTHQGNRPLWPLPFTFDGKGA